MTEPLMRLTQVGGEWERYWRVIHLDGTIPAEQWSIRPFGPQELARLRPVGHHPWTGRENGRVLNSRLARVGTVPLEALAIANSSFPYGFNEGPVWAGRGMTGVLRAGGWLAAGPLTAMLAPVAFAAQNLDFPTYSTAATWYSPFAFPFTDALDAPQRFGERLYARVGLGNSFARVDVGGLAGGVSTAAQHWGPGRDHPPVLGSNAGGFPHVFLGSSRAMRLGPLRVHGRMIWGRLSQSEHTAMHALGSHRLVSAVVGTVSPVAVPGLELGASRFAQMLWRDGVLTARNLFRPFGRTFGDGLEDPHGISNPENQIASLFGRWVFPAAGLEVYGEWVKEDGALGIRTLLQEPDHDAGYLLGAQRAWRPGADSSSRRVVRAEVLNTRIKSVHLVPYQVPFYQHTNLRQGHTHGGLPLGSAGGFGGGAATAAYDRYSTRGRWSLTYSRIMRAEYVVLGVPQHGRADVYHALGVDGILFRGATAFTYEATAVREMNRHFADDAFNVRVSLGTRYSW